MKTTIYYFSATGNSLSVSRDIAAGIGDADLIPIAGLTGERIIKVPEGRVGFVFPVYYFSIPRIVRNFLEKLDLSAVSYCFAVVTMGGIQGETLSLTNKILKERGKALDAGYTVSMPGNYVALYNVPNPEKQKKIFAKADVKIKSIVRDVVNKVPHPCHGGPVSWLGAFVHKFATRELSDQDRNFSVDDTCTGCGICAKVCPVNDITIENDRPVWHHRCETCFACINYCPEHAIQFGKRSRKFGRYHHPDVKISDISLQNEFANFDVSDSNGGI